MSAPKKAQVKYEIPPEGSMALFAYGAKGIRAWREKRAETTKKQEAPKSK